MLVRDALENLNGEYTVSILGQELQIGERKMSAILKYVGIVFEGSKWVFQGDENTLDTQISDYKNKVNAKGEPINNKPKPKNTKVQSSTPKNIDFTEEEKEILKTLVQERKHDFKLFHEYKVYDEIKKVPIGSDQVRSAFNMSKETTERLKKYASVRRLPLQDLVELAVINLLDQYDK